MVLYQIILFLINLHQNFINLYYKFNFVFFQIYSFFFSQFNPINILSLINLPKIEPFYQNISNLRIARKLILYLFPKYFCIH